MASLKVDLDVLNRTIHTYNDEIENIENARTNVQRALRQLEHSGWKSQASEAWFSLLDDEWLQNIRFQIRVLKRLRDNMVIAKSEYQDIDDERKRLDDVL